MSVHDTVTFGIAVILAFLARALRRARTGAARDTSRGAGLCPAVPQVSSYYVLLLANLTLALRCWLLHLISESLGTAS